MATYGIPGTPTYSVTFNSLDDMMASVPDNNRQAIGATSVRYSLFTLWDRITTYATGSVGLQGWQGSQGWQGIVGFQGIQGIQGGEGPTGIQGLQGIQGIIGATGTGYIINYNISVRTMNGYPTQILGASTSDGIILHNGTTWSYFGWSSDPIGNGSNNFLIKINHPLSKRLLNMTTHGTNGSNIYSIAVYGKSPAGTQFCTLVQPTDFSYFSLYGVSYMSTACAQTGTSSVVITFQS
jgi:hypothetical protein